MITSVLLFVSSYLWVAACMAQFVGSAWRAARVPLFGLLSAKEAACMSAGCNVLLGSISLSRLHTFDAAMDAATAALQFWLSRNFDDDDPPRRKKLKKWVKSKLTKPQTRTIPVPT